MSSCVILAGEGAPLPRLKLLLALVRVVWLAVVTVVTVGALEVPA
jgi:hypothetical protein